MINTNRFIGVLVFDSVHFNLKVDSINFQGTNPLLIFSSWRIRSWWVARILRSAHSSVCESRCSRSICCPRFAITLKWGSQDHLGSFTPYESGRIFGSEPCSAPWALFPAEISVCYSQAPPQICTSRFLRQSGEYEKP